MNTDVKFDFTGKRFVVTGASSGIGRQLALDLAQAGALVLGIARRASELNKLAALCPEQIIVASCDVNDKDALETIIKNFVHTHGKIDGSIHAAGVFETTSTRLFIKEVAEQIVNTSLWGGVNLINITSKAKISNNNSSHVLISSVRAHKGAKGSYIYAAAKAGLCAMTGALAAEMAVRNQRINTISPGWIQSEMTDKVLDTLDIETVKAQHLLGLGAPEQVTKVIMFLLSSASSWITGTDIIVDGGYLS